MKIEIKFIIRPPYTIVDTMGSTMLFYVGVSLLVGCVWADPLNEFRSNFEWLGYDTNLDEPAYRLLDTVQPTYLTVDLDVYLSESRFNGLVTIQVTTTESLSQIVLHQKVVSILAVSVVNAQGVPVPLQNPLPFETDDYFEIIKINLAQAIAAGNYVITISYLGQINENPFDRGFYRGYYFAGNERRYYATTQFQPYHARKAFPCFDEPQFKSRFLISITRDSNLSPSYSNMAIATTVEVATGRIRETFLPTPIVSAYLVAFHVSDFVETGETSTVAKPFQIVSRPGVTAQHSYAAEIGLEITNQLDSYLDINYYDMGQGQPMKNDHIALPDFPSGAMENWGMVNYREAYLLYDPANTNLINKIFIATIMAHELAHKWFGNLVTCFWWSNLWLNESFASFFEYFAAHMADENLELADQFVVDYVHSALNWDAGAGATPMNWTEVDDNPSISAHFSTTSYAKGASVLRMMEHFVGPVVFRDALREYLSENAYGLGTPEGMYAAFTNAVAGTTFATEYPGIDVANVFDSWVQTRGSPVLNVYVNTSAGGIYVSQERYQLTGTPPTSLWQIPLTWTDSGSPDFDNIKPRLVLTEASAVIDNEPGHRWVVFNLRQSGLYRVNYDDHNWEMIASALRDDVNVIHKLNRAQIVNDVLHFIRSGDITIERGFDVLSFLEHETDYYVWNGALSQLDWIRRRLEHIPEAHEQFDIYLLNLLEHAIEHLGYDERTDDSVSTILNRMQLLNYACNLGHEGCISDSLEKWSQFRENPTNLVPVNSRRYVYCIGLRNGNAADYQFLFQQYESSENTADMVIILRALACTRDENSLRHYLEQSLSNDRIRLHDRTNAFAYALQGNRENLDIVLNFVYTRYNDIAQNYGGVARLTLALNQFATFLTDFEHIVEFQRFVYENQVQLGSAFNTGISVVDTSMNNIRWANDIAVELFSEVRRRNSATALATPLVLLVVALATHYFR